ncbi:MAG: glutathione S-transferase [Rhodobacteraceae bacterium]|nr:glutathione S-transferase [Paracoccaceae bacterium]
MTYDLAIGDRAYSSWSLRGWLLFDAFGLPVRTHMARLATDELPRLLQDYAPARTVPALRAEDGAVVADSLAMAEELASRHPEAGIWPALPTARAAARMLAAEMHSSYAALRQACPMNLRVAYTGFAPSEAVRADLARIEALWAWARGTVGDKRPWLCGAYSAADAFYAPVAARIAGYDLPVGPEAAAYVAAHLAHPSFRRWRAMGLVDGPDQDAYRLELTRRDWPGPTPRVAEAVAQGPAENATCPYSGKPVKHFLRLEGRIFGFCNPFCRDKTAADPEAWPAFMALVG